MPLRSCCRAVILIACVAFCAAVEHDPLGVEAVAQGPWIQVLPKGGVRVGALLVPPVDRNALAALHVTVDGTTQPATLTCQVNTREESRQSALVAVWWTILPRERRPGSIDIGGHPMGRIPAVPSREAPFRIAVIGPRNYPERSQLEDLGKALGGPIDLVVGLGSGLERRLGLGGWEADYPLAIMAPPPVEGGAAWTLLGPEVSQWGHGADFGALGLVTGGNGDALALAVGRSEAAWPVAILPEAPWDPGVLAKPEVQGVERLASWIGVASPMRLPLLLGGSGTAGLVTEPLRLDKQGRLRVAPGGARYVLATPSGDGVRSLVPEVALGLDRAGLLGLAATRERLTLAVSSVGEEQPLRMAWARPAGGGDEADESGAGWGRGSGLTLAQAFREARQADPPGDGPLADLVLLPREALALGAWDTLEALTLARPTGRKATPDELRLVERLLADPWFLGDQSGLIRRLPPELQRTAVLRWMGMPEQELQIWNELAATCRDDHLVRALLVTVETAPTPAMVDILVRRLQAQSEGRLPVDADPLLQSRLTSAVFGSSLVSPTPLRELGRALAGRLHPLGWQPVQRFLERKGRFRPTE